VEFEVDASKKVTGKLVLQAERMVSFEVLDVLDYEVIALTYP
jgi:hypothetical protein